MSPSIVDVILVIFGMIAIGALGALVVLIRLLLRSNDRIKELKIETAALRAEVEHLAQKINTKE